MAKKEKTRRVALVRLTSLHSTLISRQQIVVSFCSQLTITPSGSSINIASSMLELRQVFQATIWHIVGNTDVRAVFVNASQLHSKCLRPLWFQNLDIKIHREYLENVNFFHTVSFSNKTFVSIKHGAIGHGDGPTELTILMELQLSTGIKTKRNSRIVSVYILTTMDPEIPPKKCWKINLSFLSLGLYTRQRPTTIIGCIELIVLWSTFGVR